MPYRFGHRDRIRFPLVGTLRFALPACCLTTLTLLLASTRVNTEIQTRVPACRHAATLAGMDDELLRVQEVARIVRVNPETVRRWIRSGRLPALLAGTMQSGFRVRRSDLNTFLAESAQLRLPEGKALAA